MTTTIVGNVTETTSCIIDWPPQWIPVEQHWYPHVPTYQSPPNQHTHYHFAQPLSDADVERIARRVAELLKGSGGNTP